MPPAKIIPLFPDSPKPRNTKPRAASKALEPAPLFQIKITLQHSSPPIWRRVVVRSDTKLSTLHNIIQCVMPWFDEHLHQFVSGRNFYGIPEPSNWGGPETLNEKKYVITDLVSTAKSKLIYEYDFGDGWLHEVVIEKILPADPELSNPICLAGANACPPEDSGGMFGYYEKLQIIADRKHPEREEILDWMGGSWNANAFDLAPINKRLQRIRF